MPDGTYWFGEEFGPFLIHTDANRRRLIINEFDTTTKSYTGKQWFYRMENTFESGQAIGDFTAVNATQFLVIERDGGQGAGALFKKVFLIDISVVDADGFVQKTEIVDLLNILDPLDLDGDGNNTFRFPFVTIESVAIVNANTLLIANDNNFPFSSGRTPGVADNNEFILLTLPNSLRLVPEPSTWMLGFANAPRASIYRRDSRRFAQQDT